MASNGWITPRVTATTVNTGPTNADQAFDVQQGVVDLEQLARDSIAELISSATMSKNKLPQSIVRSTHDCPNQGVSGKRTSVMIIS